MTQKITVLGAGPGGYVAAIRAAQMGGEVTVIEKENVGGTCLNWGCIPSKVLKRSADMLQEFKHAKEFGITVGGDAACDMGQLMARKESIIQSQSKGILGLFKKHNIRYILGDAFINGPGSITATEASGETHDVAYDKLIIATGSRPLNIPAFPLDGERVISSNEALALTEVPRSITIVGGGVIGCEFAFILNALGSDVTVVEAMDRLLPLPSVDEECSKLIMREMKKKKIKVLVNRTVQSVNNEGDFEVVIGPSPFAEKLKEKDKVPVTQKADKLLVCIGRTPNSDKIGLENIGVETDDRGWIKADDALRTSAENVFAIGDILGPPKVMLAHVASTEGEIAVDNIMGKEKTMQYDVIPGAIFTMPEVGNVGLSEAEAKEKYDGDVRGDSVLFRTIGKAQVLGEIAGFAKIVSQVSTGKVLGVHIAGPHATDLIGEATLAISMGASVKDIAETIHAHPTLAEVMLEASFKALDLPLHG